MQMTGSRKGPRQSHALEYLRALARDRENHHRDMTRDEILAWAYAVSFRVSARE